MENEARHYCSKCGKKRYEDKLIYIYYPMLRKAAWHCREHAWYPNDEPERFFYETEKPKRR